MSNPGARREVEIKLTLSDAAAGRRLLRGAGFRLSRNRVFETNLVLDTPGSNLLSGGRLLRLRSAGKQGLLTFKGRARAGRHKSREELEVPLKEIDAMKEILDRLGYRTVFRYEKFRSEFREPGGEGVAMLDETPIGVFLELEGPPAWIDSRARSLGFTAGDYITLSYGALYRNYCAARRRKAGDMVFKSGTAGAKVLGPNYPSKRNADDPPKI